jgi:hypothetical protein
LKLLGWFVGLLLALQIGFSVLAGHRLIDALSQIDFYFLLTLTLIVAIPAITPFFQMRARKRNGWDVPMKVELDDDGISIDHPLGAQRTFWKALPKVQATRDRLFLFTSSSCAYILPKRCFPSEADFMRWIEFSEERWAESRTGS